MINWFKRMPDPCLVLAGLMLCFWTVAAHAHPHVWADMRSEILVADDGMIAGVRVEWTTDKDYAKDALTGLDVNNDGAYDTEELARLTEENLSALADYGYFIYFRLNGAAQDIGTAKDGVQAYNAQDGRLTLQFTVPLKTPLDPHSGRISLKIYDPEFFIAFNYVKTKPLLISKTLPPDCSAILQPLQSDAELEQTRAMLATKDRSWKPENDEDFGAMFAQAAEIACNPS